MLLQVTKTFFENNFENIFSKTKIFYLTSFLTFSCVFSLYYIRSFKCQDNLITQNRTILKKLLKNLAFEECFISEINELR